MSRVDLGFALFKMRPRALRFVRFTPAEVNGGITLNFLWIPHLTGLALIWHLLPHTERLQNATMTHIAKSDPRQYLSIKRARKALKKRWRGRRKHLDSVRSALYSEAKRRQFGPTSKVLKLFADGRSGHQFLVPQTSLRVVVPKVFSLFDEPEQAINFVSSFAKTYRAHWLSDVQVAMGNVVAQDLGAHVLLDKIVDEIVNHCSFTGAKLSWRGDYPKDPAQARFIRSMGIVRQLRLTKKYVSADEASKIIRFERSCRHYIRAIKPEVVDDKTKAAAKFADHVNGCLEKAGKAQLTQTARHLLCSYVGEVLDNAEAHAGMMEWTIQGYLDISVEKPYCEIVVFNLGKSIAETLEELHPDHYTVRQISNYLHAHTKNNLFSHSWRREDLLTLVALQGAVSSKNTSLDTTRGNGMADLIEFFQTMHDALEPETVQKPRMFIVSGGTRVVFDGSYRMAKNVHGTRLIAFNSTNDLHLPPDRHAVMPLKNSYLPGTMIGIKFPLEISSLKGSGVQT
jgi:hypothetical protein